MFKCASERARREAEWGGGWWCSGGWGWHICVINWDWMCQVISTSVKEKPGRRDRQSDECGHISAQSVEGGWGGSRDVWGGGWGRSRCGHGHGEGGRGNWRNCRIVNAARKKMEHVEMIGEKGGEEGMEMLKEETTPN